jgi:hypothetical protein
MKTTLPLALAALLAAAPAMAQTTAGNAVIIVPEAAGRECHSTTIDDSGSGTVIVRWGQRAEFGGCRITVSDFDTDRNGRISADEVPPAHSLGRAFSSLDLDQDGYIDDPELQAGHWQ